MTHTHSLVRHGQLIEGRQIPRKQAPVVVQLVHAVSGPHFDRFAAQISNKVVSSMKPWILDLQQNQCNINVDTASTGQSTLKVPPGGRAPPARV